MTNPWLNETVRLGKNRFKVGPASVEDRLANLRLCTARQLKAIILYTGTQKTVRVAAVRMLKRREKDVNKSRG